MCNQIGKLIKPYHEILIINGYSCMEIYWYSCFNPLSKGTKINVQIRRFTRCLNMGLNFKILKMSPELFT